MSLDPNYVKEQQFLNCTSLNEAKQLVNDCTAGGVMVSIHDTAGNYKLVSKSSKTFFLYEPEELIGNSAYDYFHPEDFQTILKSHAKVTIRPEIDRVKYRIITKSKDAVNVYTQSRQIKDPSGQEFILAFTVRN